MANAEGGYILIGVSEKNDIAQGFFTVPEVEKVIRRISEICRDFIDPSIPDLEVKEHNLQWNQKGITLVIIRIPLSEKRPHGFRSKGTNNFVRRHVDGTKEYTTSELTKDLLLLHQVLDTNQSVLRASSKKKCPVLLKALKDPI